jgi:hypothetical protein
MHTFEWIIVLLLGAALLATLARKLGAPYPTFLALGGALLAFVPASPNWTLDPQLALTLFVAPVLVDAAYDTSLRDLRANWRPVAGLVLAAVGTTVLAVALVARWLVPEMPWPVAIALGAIVAPPDAAAATAVMRQVKLPHKLLKILEGESLLNDASALLVYRLAIMTMMAGHLGFGSVAPVFLLTVFGSPRRGRGLRVCAATADERLARCAGLADRSVRLHLRRVDRGRSRRPVGHPDAGRVRDDDGSARRPADASAHAGADLRGVGGGGVRAERVRVRVDRDAVAADLGAAGQRRCACRCARHGCAGVGRHDRGALCLGDELQRIEALAP